MVLPFVFLFSFMTSSQQGWNTSTGMWFYHIIILTWMNSPEEPESSMNEVGGEGVGNFLIQEIGFKFFWRHGKVPGHRAVV